MRTKHTEYWVVKDYGTPEEEFWEIAGNTERRARAYLKDYFNVSDSDFRLVRCDHTLLPKRAAGRKP